MKKRIITGIVGGLYLGLATYYGGAFFTFTIMGIVMIALFELDRSVIKGWKSVYKVNYLSALILFGLRLFHIDYDLYMMMTGHTVLVAIVYVIEEKSQLKDLAISFFAFVYIILLFYQVILFVSYPHFWLVYVITFSADSMAYIVGSNFGKHKLSPKLSPKKSIEGAIGGIVGAIAATLIFNYFVLSENIGPMVFIAAVGAIVSIFGDLVCSKIKREFSIKDYSQVLPGHGGMLDRFDSLLLVSPVTYFLVLIFFI